MSETQANTTCFSWIKDLSKGNITTLEDINYFFLQRNLGGIVFISLMLLFGLFGNFSVIWVYAKHFKATNFRTYTLWLASLDMTNCCLGMPFLLLYHTHYLTFPDVTICKGGRFVMVFTANASAFLLVVIAIDRYVHVCKPFNMTNISPKQTRLSCFVAAGLGILISWPAIVLFGNHTFDELPFKNMTGTRCWEEDRFQHQNYLADYYIVLSALSFIITVVLFIVYSLIVRFIYKYKIANRTEHTRKVTVILFSVTLAYVLSALPHNVLLVILFTKRNFQCELTFVQGFVLYICVWSNLVNNAVNPIIYGYSDAKFRQEIKQMFSRLHPTCRYSRIRTTSDCTEKNSPNSNSTLNTMSFPVYGS